MNFMYGNDPGMPSLGTLGVGDLARVLDAALVNGGTTQSITSITRSGATATATKTAHGFRNQQRVVISGATQTEYNGTFRITVTGANTFTFPVTGTPATPATGSPVAGIAPLGNWGIAFTATNQRAYRAASGLRHYLMVNDNSNTNTCIVRGFNAMTGVTTGTGPFPTTTQSSTNLKWLRPDPTGFPSTSAPNDSWFIAGDDKRFIIGICVNATGDKFWHGFGEAISYKPSDVYSSFIFGAANTAGDDTLAPTSDPKVSVIQHSTQGAGSYYNAALALNRAQNQTTLSYMCGLLAGLSNQSVAWNSSFSGAPAVGTSSPISGGIELATVDILENTSGSLYYRRGRMPYLCSWNSPDFQNNDGTVYSNITNFGDVLIVAGGANDTTGGMIFPVGDWDSVLT